MMKIALICIGVVAASGLYAQTPASTPNTNHEKLESIELRVNGGDLNAFSEVSNMDAKVAVHFLYFRYIRLHGRGDKSQAFTAAKAAIRNVKGAVPYLKQVLIRLETEKQAHIDGFDSYSAWETLSVIGGMDAAAVAAPYLFRSGPDFKGNNPEGYASYAENAAFYLMWMNLPDNPTPGDPEFQNPDVPKWQQWAIAHKLAGPGINAPAANPSTSPTPNQKPPAQ